MPGARRAPPAPPSDAEATPPPLPSRVGQSSRPVAVPDSGPPPLPPSRPGAAAEPADDMYEDMNGGFPRIIDAKSCKRNTAQAMLPPSHNSSSNSRQQQNLEMEDTYEVPDFHGISANQQERNKPDLDDDSGEDAWPDEFDEVENHPQPIGDETYERPEDLAMPEMDETYEQPDGAALFNKRTAPPPSPRGPKGAHPINPTFNPAALQIGKLKLNSISSQPRESSKTNLTQMTAASNKERPEPPPKPTPNQDLGGSSIVQALARELNERGQGGIRPFEKKETKENPTESDSSGGSTTAQTSAQPPVVNNSKPAILFPRPNNTKTENPKLPKVLPTPPPKKPEKQNLQVLPEPDDQDDIYDECVSDSLLLYDWYHQKVSRTEAAARVRSVGETGAFLIRESTKANPSHPYTLVVLNNGKVHNLIIRQRSDGDFALGDVEKSDELAFSTVKALMEHHKTNQVRLLKEKEFVMLTSYAKRP